MSNHAWVCFACRTTTRRPPIAKDVRCRICRKPCDYLGYKTPIPARAKVKIWRALHHSYQVSLNNYRTRQWQQAVRTRHDLEREIVRLTALPTNKGRAFAIEQIRKRLEKHRAS